MRPLQLTVKRVGMKNEMPQSVSFTAGFFTKFQPGCSCYVVKLSDSNSLIESHDGCLAAQGSVVGLILKVSVAVICFRDLMYDPLPIRGI